MSTVIDALIADPLRTNRIEWANPVCTMDEAGQIIPILQDDDEDEDPYFDDPDADEDEDDDFDDDDDDVDDDDDEDDEDLDESDFQEDRAPLTNTRSRTNEAHPHHSRPDPLSFGLIRNG